MRLRNYKLKIEVPQGMKANLIDNTITVEGLNGKIERKIMVPKINISLENNAIILSTKVLTKKEKRIINSWKSHIKNMFKGIEKSFIYKLKICSGHFPMAVSVEKNSLVIQNFLGEKIPRKARILDGVNVKVENDLITVQGIDKDKTGQTAANIEKATLIKGRDRRVFQDGIYITNKDYQEIK